MAKEIMLYTLTRKLFYDATGTLNGLKSEYITPLMGFMDIEKSKINLHALKRHLLIRTGQGGTTLLIPLLTRPPLTRQDFRSPCDVELAGGDCITYW